jgi:hypothetical protein
LAVDSVALVIGAFGLTGCAAINKVKNAVHVIRGNKATIDAFTSKLQSGAASTFEAKYVTTGSDPTTIVYAVQPPTGVAFSETPSGGNGDTIRVHLVGKYLRRVRLHPNVRERPVELPEVGSSQCRHAEQGLRTGRRTRRRFGLLVDDDGQRIRQELR